MGGSRARARVPWYPAGPERRAVRARRGDRPRQRRAGLGPGAIAGPCQTTPMSPAALLLVFLALFGLAVGSFLNVCIHRVPARVSVVSPGSRCPSCGYALGWADNIPVVSYALLRGRCRSCRARISIRYPIVELVT